MTDHSTPLSAIRDLLQPGLNHLTGEVGAADLKFRLAVEFGRGEIMIEAALTTPPHNKIYAERLLSSDEIASEEYKTLFVPRALKAIARANSSSRRGTEAHVVGAIDPRGTEPPL